MRKILTKNLWNIEVWAVQKHVNLVDLVKSFPTNIFLQNLASMQKRTSPVTFAHLAEKSGKGSTSNLSTKRRGGGATGGSFWPCFTLEGRHIWRLDLRRIRRGFYHSRLIVKLSSRSSKHTLFPMSQIWKIQSKCSLFSPKMFRLPYDSKKKRGRSTFSKANIE